LSDSSGNGFHLTNGSGATAASQFTLPGSGNGSAYPTTIPSSGAANGGAVSFDGGDILSTPDNAAFMTTVFTIEAFVTTTTLGATQDPSDRRATGWQQLRAELFVGDQLIRRAAIEPQRHYDLVQFDSAGTEQGLLCGGDGGYGGQQLIRNH